MILTLLLAAATTLFTLPDIEVTAEAPELQSSTYRLIYSITEEEIEALPAVSVNEILTYLPGIDVRTRGANGSQADINMRGGTFDQVMILINGVSITDPQTGHYTMNLPISTDIITKIEILEGTAVNLLGTSAFAGAINIITRPDTLSLTSSPTSPSSPSPYPIHSEGPSKVNRKSIESQSKVNASLVGGRWGLWDAALSGKWVLSKAWHVASAQYSQSTGYIPNTDYRLANLYYATSFYGVELQVGAQYKDAGANSFYSLASQDQYDATRTAFLTARYAHNWGRWGLEAQASYRANYDRYEWHRGTITNRHLNQTAAASIRAHYASSWGKTTLGIEARNENILSTGLGDTIATPQGIFPLGKNRFNVNYFAQQTVSIGIFSAALGAQGHYNTVSGNEWAGGLNLGLNFVKNGKIYLNANRSMRLPTFTDLYYHAGIQRGNISLVPEYAWLIDLGLQYTYKGLALRANGYYRFGRNIIDWQKQDDGLYYASNVTKLDAAGSEIAISYHYGYWLKKIEASYTYTKSFTEALDLSKSMYLDYLSHKFIFRLEHGIWKGFGACWTLSYSVREGAYTTSAGDVVPYTPVLLLNGSVFWANDHIRVALDCTNVTNTRYYCYGGIEQPGILPRASMKVTL